MTSTTIKTIIFIWVAGMFIFACANYEVAHWYLIAGAVGMFVLNAIGAPIARAEKEKAEAAELIARQEKLQRQEKKMICPKCGRKNTTFHKELTDEYEYKNDKYEIDSGVSKEYVEDQVTYQKIRFYRKCESCSTVYDDEGSELKEVGRKEIRRRHHYTG